VFEQAIKKRLNIEKALAYNENCPFPVNYKPEMFYSTGPWTISYGIYSRKAFSTKSFILVYMPANRI